jgi:hypothetical protein
MYPCHTGTGFRSRAAASTTAADVTRRLAYDRIHRLLRALVVAVPTLPPVLWHQVNVAMPPKRESKEAHIVYLRNALRVVEYCPTLVDDLLASAVTAAITIDVRTAASEICYQWPIERTGRDPVRDCRL